MSVEMEIRMSLPLLLKPLQPLTEPSTLHGHIYLTGMVGKEVMLALGREASGVGWNACFLVPGSFTCFIPQT